MSEQLNEVLEQLQSPDVSIDQAIVLHQKGTQLIKDMQEYLKTAENQITKLTSKEV